MSEQVDSPELAPRGVRQAERAIDLGLRLGRAGQPVRYDELGIYRLLCTIGDMQQLMGFARDVLGPLLDYDAEHRTDLVHTLSVYLRHHGSHKRSARMLHLHTNTVAYRAGRIEAITGLDLNDPDDRLVAHVAVKSSSLKARLRFRPKTPVAHAATGAGKTTAAPFPIGFLVSVWSFPPRFGAVACGSGLRFEVKGWSPHVHERGVIEVKSAFQPIVLAAQQHQVADRGPDAEM